MQAEASKDKGLCCKYLHGLELVQNSIFSVCLGAKTEYPEASKQKEGIIE